MYFMLYKLTFKCVCDLNQLWKSMSAVATTVDTALGAKTVSNVYLILLNQSWKYLSAVASRVDTVLGSKNLSNMYLFLHNQSRKYLSAVASLVDTTLGSKIISNIYLILLNQSRKYLSAVASLVDTALGSKNISNMCLILHTQSRKLSVGCSDNGWIRPCEPNKFQMFICSYLINHENISRLSRKRRIQLSEQKKNSNAYYILFNQLIKYLTDVAINVDMALVTKKIPQ